MEKGTLLVELRKFDGTSKWQILARNYEKSDFYEVNAYTLKKLYANAVGKNKTEFDWNESKKTKTIYLSINESKYYSRSI